jgi:hypothetical protein
MVFKGQVVRLAPAAGTENPKYPWPNTVRFTSHECSRSVHMCWEWGPSLLEGPKLPAGAGMDSAQGRPAKPVQVLV